MAPDPGLARAAGGRAPLRIGVLLEAGPMPRWRVDLLAELRETPFLSVVLLVQVARAPDLPVGWTRRWTTLVADGSTLLQRCYAALDHRVFAAGPDPLEPIDGSAAMHGIARHVAGPADAVERDERDSRDDRDVRQLQERDVEELLRADLDVLLNLGSFELAGRALGTARHGVWSCAFGESGGASPWPAGCREVLQGLPTTIVGVRTAGHRAGTPRTTLSHIRTQRFSISRNVFHLHRKARMLLRFKLQELFEAGPGEARARTEPAGERDSGASVPGMHGNLSTLQGAARVAAWSLRRAASRADLPGGWFLAYGLHDHDAGHPALAANPDRFITLRPPPDRFWADPFNVLVNGLHYLFFEEYTSATGIGHIAMMALGDDGRWSPPVPVLERNYHLSYPFVFEWQGALYMVPETLGAGRVEMYRAAEFPHRWEYHSTLIDGIEAVDPTLVEKDGRWWMFLGSAQNAEGCPTDLSEQLHLFHAPTPLGPWEPHRRNPVKWDVRSSRPAGRLFWRDGELFRPAQECAERYGHAIRIHKVLRLDTEEYLEAEVSAIEPTWAPDLIGTHTINSVPGLTVIDGRSTHRGSRAVWRRQRLAPNRSTLHEVAGTVQVAT